MKKKLMVWILSAALLFQTGLPVLAAQEEGAAQDVTVEAAWDAVNRGAASASNTVIGKAYENFLNQSKFHNHYYAIANGAEGKKPVLMISRDAQTSTSTTRDYSRNIILYNYVNGKVVSLGKIDRRDGYWFYGNGHIGTDSFVRDSQGMPYFGVLVISGASYKRQKAEYSSSVYSILKFTKNILPSATTITKAAGNADSGIKITWKKAGNATGYRVYRREGSGSWKKLKDVYSGLTYTDKTAKAGKKYSYYVRPFRKTGSSLRWAVYNNKYAFAVTLRANGSIYNADAVLKGRLSNMMYAIERVTYSHYHSSGTDTIQPSSWNCLQKMNFVQEMTALGAGPVKKSGNSAVITFDQMNQFLTSTLHTSVTKTEVQRKMNKIPAAQKTDDYGYSYYYHGPVYNSNGKVKLRFLNYTDAAYRPAITSITKSGNQMVVKGKTTMYPCPVRVELVKDTAITGVGYRIEKMMFYW